MSSPYELVGPVLPQALRLARYQASASLPQNTDDLQSENDMINQTPSREEERLLMSNANVMTALEDLFSWRHKDRTSRTSKLSRVESVRFQRAMYRIWLMSVLYGPRRFVPSHIGLTNETFMVDLNKSWKDQKSFLQQLSSQELFQIKKLAHFLILTVNWCIMAEGIGLGGAWDAYDRDGMFLFAGPHIILRCYEEATTTHLPVEYLADDGPYTAFLTHAFSEIIQERRVTEPFGHVGTILDDINGEHDRCHHCGSHGYPDVFKSDVRWLPNLYNETNWDYLKGDLEREYLARNLSSNPIESKALTLALIDDWSRLFHQLYTCRGDEYSQWSKEDWICASCWHSFVEDTIWRYRLAQKKKAGERIAKDCMYGYDCKKQCYESGLAHAKEFNHLCQSTK